MTKPIRVLIAKVGLDGHDRGARVLTLRLRDEGFEVIYTGIRQSPESIVQTAIQENVDILGLSCLSGAHLRLFPRVIETLKKNGCDDILVVAGGVIPVTDIPILKAMGISAVFVSGSTIKEISKYFRENVKKP